jgi:hypothetical protein
MILVLYWYWYCMGPEPQKFGRNEGPVVGLPAAMIRPPAVHATQNMSSQATIVLATVPYDHSRIYRDGVLGYLFLETLLQQ